VKEVEILGCNGKVASMLLKDIFWRETINHDIPAVKKEVYN